MKIALVHDYLVQNGGAEKVLEAFCELFPDAPIYTLVYNPKLMHGNFSDRQIHTSFLQKIPLATMRHRVFPQFMSFAIEQFDFSDFDIVLSDSSSFAKGAITGPETLHLCYMHTPMRFAWDDCQRYNKEFYFPGFVKKMVPFAMNYIRLWDRASADRPDKIIANSKFIARRIKKYYKRDSVVINPPVDVDRFSVSLEKDDYYLAAGRLMSYKKFDIVIEAFNRLGRPLKIIGRGPEFRRLKKKAKPNIEFLGRVNDEDLRKYFSRCQGFIFPQEEDFGIMAIEVMASGTPLIAFRGGDIPEHIEEGKTGIFFENQTPEDIEAAVLKFNNADFNGLYIRNSVLGFDKKFFKDRMKSHIEKEFQAFKDKKRSPIYGTERIFENHQKIR